MGYMVIHRKDKEKMSDMVSEMLRIGGRLMECIEDMEEDGYGERGNYGSRSGMGMRDGGSYGSRGDYGNRWEDPYDMRERRGRR